MNSIATPPQRLPAISGEPAIDPADWTPNQLAGAMDWIVELEPSDIAEIDTAIGDVETRGLEIMDIGIDDFPLPGLDSKLATVRHQLMDGRGVALLRGLPVERLGAARTAMAYRGLGLRIGEPVSQNAGDTYWVMSRTSWARTSRRRRTGVIKPTRRCTTIATPATWPPCCACARRARAA